jgi:hypothetical protein
MNNPVLGVLGHTTEEVTIGPGMVLELQLPDLEVTATMSSIINENVRAKRDRRPTPHPGTLFLVGYLKYGDEIGSRRTYFVFKYDVETLRFEPVDHPNYSYEE